MLYPLWDSGRGDNNALRHATSCDGIIVTIAVNDRLKPLSIERNVIIVFDSFTVNARLPTPGDALVVGSCVGPIARLALDGSAVDVTHGCARRMTRTQ